MSAPPPKPPQRPGAPGRPGLAKQPAPSSADALAQAKREKEELERETQGIEEELEALKAKYDLYFLGVERREPVRWREELRKKVLRVKGAFTRNTGLKFRIQSLHARYLSYERLWLRSAREKEEGTYRRDLFKARLHRRQGEEAAEPVTPPAPSSPEEAAPASAAKGEPAQAGTKATSGATRGADLAASALPRAAASAPGQPVKAPAPGPAAASTGGGMSEAQMRALYDAYLAAKVTCREDVSRLTYDAVARTVSRQIPELLTRYKARSVEFKVEVKEGRAVLKAIPKL